MQDVCISFWKEDGTSDMMLKVTDICSTDPSDPTHCANPGDIKIDRAKAKVMQGLSSDPKGDEYPEPVWWFFMKCWADVSSILYLPHARCERAGRLNTSLTNRVSHNLHTNISLPATGSPIHLYRTIFSGPKKQRLSNTLTIRKLTPPTAGRHTRTVHTTPRETVRRAHRSMIGFQDRSLNGLRSLAEKASVNDRFPSLFLRLQAHPSTRTLLRHQAHLRLPAQLRTRHPLNLHPNRSVRITHHQQNPVAPLQRLLQHPRLIVRAPVQPQ